MQIYFLSKLWLFILISPSFTSARAVIVMSQVGFLDYYLTTLCHVIFCNYFQHHNHFIFCFFPSFAVPSVWVCSVLKPPLSANPLIPHCWPGSDPWRLHCDHQFTGFLSQRGTKPKGDAFETKRLTVSLTVMIRPAMTELIWNLLHAVQQHELGRPFKTSLFFILFFFRYSSCMNIHNCTEKYF